MKNRLFSLSVIIILAALNLSCEVAEPERFYNDKAVPPKTGTFSLDDLQGGKLFWGTITIVIDTAGMNQNIGSMSFIIKDSANGDGSWSSNRYPFSFTIDTRRFSNGIHAIEVLAYNHNSPHGLLNLFGSIPTITITGKIELDNSYPAPSALSFGEFDKSSPPHLVWTQSSLRNEPRYVIWRNLENPNLYEYFDDWEPIDTIQNKSDTTYIDNSLDLIIDKDVYYKVSVINHMDMRGAFSEYISYTIGDLELKEYSNSLIASKTKPEIFYFTGQNRVIASSETNEVLDIYPVLEAVSYFIPDKYGDEVYGVAPSENKIYVYDANTYQSKGVLNITFGNIDYVWVCPGKHGEIFVKSDKNKILRINTSNGAIISERQNTQLTFGRIIISADNSKLYVDSYSDTSISLSAFDISTSQIIHVTTKELDYSASLFDMADNSIIYEMLNYGPYMYSIRIRDASTLEVISMIRPDQLYSGDLIMGALATEEKLYIAGTNNIYELDRSSLDVLRKWKVHMGANDLCLNYDSEYLYFSSYNENSVRQIYKIKLK